LKQEKGTAFALARGLGTSAAGGLAKTRVEQVLATTRAEEDDAGSQAIP